METVRYGYIYTLYYIVAQKLLMKQNVVQTLLYGLKIHLRT